MRKIFTLLMFLVTLSAVAQNPKPIPYNADFLGYARVNAYVNAKIIKNSTSSLQLQDSATGAIVMGVSNGSMALFDLGQNVLNLNADAGILQLQDTSGTMYVDIQKTNVLTPTTATTVMRSLFIDTTNGKFYSVSASPWQTDGNTLSNTGILGSLNSYDVNLYSNNVARINIDETGKIGIGNAPEAAPAAPTYDLSFGGNTAFNIGGERHTTANTAGNNGTMYLGSGATSGATDKNAGNAIISCGAFATGNGGGDIEFHTIATGQGSGTTDRTPSLKLTLNGFGYLNGKYINADNKGLYSNPSPSTSLCNLGIGADIFGQISTGKNNLVLANWNGYYITSGSYNYINSEYTLSTGSNNYIQGAQSGGTTMTGNHNFLFGSYAGTIIGSGSHNFLFGEYSGNEMDATSSDNLSFGKGGLRWTSAVVNGNINLLGGLGATNALSLASSDNIAIGRGSMARAHSGATGFNIAIGYDALRGDLSTYHFEGSYMVAIGYQAALNAYQNTKSVHLGYQAGMNETASNRLHIANNSTTSLIYGEFDNNKVQVNGELKVTKGYTSSLIDNLTSATADTLFSVSLPADSTFNSTMSYGIKATDGDTTQAESGMLQLSAVNHNGTLQHTFNNIGTAAQPSGMLGTLTKTLSCALNSNVLYVIVNVTSSIAPSTLSIRVTPDLHTSYSITKL